MISAIYENAAFKAKYKSSEQFREVADFIREITDNGELVSEYAYLAVCPWTDKRLPNKISNISTTLFCELFSNQRLPVQSAESRVHFRHRSHATVY